MGRFRLLLGLAVLLPELFVDGAASGPGGMGAAAVYAVRGLLAPLGWVISAALPADGVAAAAVAGSVSPLVPAVLTLGWGRDPGGHWDHKVATSDCLWQ